MKATLQILMLVLGLAAGCVAFAGLVGIGSPSAFFGSEAAILVYSMAGLMLMGFTDSARRPVSSRAHRDARVTAGSRPAVIVACAARQACPAA